jgi:tetratricopeptide (TPR) repeat protein
MKKRFVVFLIILFSIYLVGCNKLIDVGDPQTSTNGMQVFSHDTSALAAVSGIYTKIMTYPANILNGGISIYTGLSADELQTNNTANELQEFYTNTISPLSSNNRTYFWFQAYAIIYQTNACIEGILGSNKLSADVENQLLGESYFIRAFSYFQLVQLYGGVPLVVTTDYEVNVGLKRADALEIVNQVREDLLKATSYLNDSYPSPSRVRVNKWAAKALLAKVYLYEGDYRDAESASGQVINAGPYNLENNLDRVFLNDSKEAILQFMPVENGYNTMEGASYVPSPSGISLPQFSLTSDLLNSFEFGDKRLTSWVGTKVVNGVIYTFPFKYKLRLTFSIPYPINEYTMILRLSEQYLIRAEARAYAGDLPGAINDVDSIRKRAGLPLISVVNPSIDKVSLLTLIQKERRIELFAEWGNRWFDLKRTSKATAILGNKPQWEDYDTLYPIPKVEIRLNPSLTQNPGYN